jgi:lipopolysaccharide transport system ATP-binding protein
MAFVTGHSGAGKSTLLKLITGTSRPTEGNVWVKGRVAAILELGMGFNVDLTGRQNVYHAAGLMGFSESEIAGVIGEIEAFAEIGEYFDEPVRTYSSGMQMRVAFSVATAFRPDLLIIDEALSVGDAYFIHKCFRRIREFREAGTTLLFVSHDPTAVQSLCDRAVLIDRGRLVLDADPQQVFDYYNALIAEKENSSVRTERTEHGQVATESGSGEVEFVSLRMENAAGEAVEYVTVGEPVRLRAKVRANEVVERLVFGYMIRDRLGQPIFGTNTHHTEQVCTGLQAGESVEYEAAFPMNLGTGTYSISVALSSTETHLVKNYQWKDLALIFTVANVDQSPFVGVAWLPPKIRVLGQ